MATRRRRRKRRVYRPRFFVILFVLFALIIFGIYRLVTAGSGKQMQKETTYSNPQTQSNTEQTTSPSAMQEQGNTTGETFGTPQSVDVPVDRVANKNDYTKQSSGNLKGYRRLTEETMLYMEADEKSIVLTKIPRGTFVKYYGEQAPWALVRYERFSGYLSEQTLESMPEKTMTVKKGVLLVDAENGLPEDFRPGEDAEMRGAFREMDNALRTQMEKGLEVVSGYRTFEEQNDTLEATADGQPVVRGHSEHQTGLAVDVAVEGEKGVNEKFAETEQGKWLADNAHTFGFIQRYPSGKEKETGYRAEPWHYRYVGTAIAKELYETGQTLEEWIREAGN